MVRHSLCVHGAAHTLRHSLTSDLCSCRRIWLVHGTFPTKSTLIPATTFSNQVLILPGDCLRVRELTHELEDTPGPRAQAQGVHSTVQVLSMTQDSRTRPRTYVHITYYQGPRAEAQGVQVCQDGQLFPGSGQPRRHRFSSRNVNDNLCKFFFSSTICAFFLHKLSLRH